MGAAANLDAVAGTRASSWQCATTNKKEGAEAICWKLGRGVKEWERFLERFLTLALSSNEEERGFEWLRECMKGWLGGLLSFIRGPGWEFGVAIGTAVGDALVVLEDCPHAASARGIGTVEAKCCGVT